MFRARVSQISSLVSSMLPPAVRATGASPAIEPEPRSLYSSSVSPETPVVSTALGTWLISASQSSLTSRKWDAVRGIHRGCRFELYLPPKATTGPRISYDVGSPQTGPVIYLEPSLPCPVQRW
ncbi:hypothetical protein B0H10DRAFT_407097 [Mycena sp. CBHHK59/15]|nr:hypothetical protein B0H10DRAFT_407097 [Mycena sp. CBHHK59/15]